MKLTVYGEPVGKGRPRASTINGHARMYTPSKTLSYEAKVKETYISSFGETKPSTKAYRVSIVAFFGLAKADYKKDGTLNGHGLRKVENIEHCHKKPDLDNIAKAVTDSLNGLLYLDDSQIVWLYVEKRFGETPRVEIDFEEIE